MNVKTPFLRTSKAANLGAKTPWKVEVDGKVEAAFLFGTALAEDLVPFAIRRLRLVILPLMTRDGKLIMLHPDEMLEEGAPLACDWVKQAEAIWEEKKKATQPSIYDYLNYDQKLTKQNPQAQFVVLYNRSGTNIAASYLTPSEFGRVGLLPIRGFIADFAMYRCYASSESEAGYLAGILNSSFVNEAIKPYQTHGLKGERDITRRPFEVCPIPLFDPKNSLHREISAVASDARQVMVKWRHKIEGNAAQARKAARNLIQPELGKLNDLVATLMEREGQVEVTPPGRGPRTASLFAKPKE